MATKPLVRMLAEAGIEKIDTDHLSVLTKTEASKIIKTLWPEVTIPKTQVGMVKVIMDMARQDKVLVIPTPKPQSKPESKSPTKPKGPKVDRGPKPCGCGCLEPGTKKPAMTKGGRFLPGHDAKFHAIQNGGIKRTGPRPCACGCIDPETNQPALTRGGKWRPGHDAIHYSRLLAQERAKAAQVAPKSHKKRKPEVKK